MLIQFFNHSIFAFSDTHGRHRELQVPEKTDILICAGDAVEDNLLGDDIPTDLDILVTHYPPLGILDEDMGSVEILNFVMKSQPSYHLFGHIHFAKGKEVKFGKTQCLNISHIY